MQRSQIAIIGAMDQEIELYLTQLNNKTIYQKAGITFYLGEYCSKSIVLCKCGVGKVNASIVTQICIIEFGVKQIIFTGVAGAMDPHLDILDVVISSECLHHDMDVTPLGFKIGEIPYQKKSVFKADPSLIQHAIEASKEIVSYRVRVGRILTGDQFISSREKIQDLFNTLHGSCIEMEGAAVAQVCDAYEIPFVIIRSMSDRADGIAHKNFQQFLHESAKNSYLLVTSMLKSLS